jgi:hypothetical protein
MLTVDFGHGFRYGIIVGKTQFIVTETDFVHGMQSKLLTVLLPVEWDRSGDSAPDADGWQLLPLKTVNKTFALGELLALATETELRDFGHYWGIKDRVRTNYGMLLDSMKDIGADVSVMPEWGK